MSNTPPQLTFYNTRTRTQESFTPLDTSTVRMYHCGPTVYGPPHIGNLRAYVFADIVRRACEHAGYTVEQVINITDIGHLTSNEDHGEDKMLSGLKREGLPLTLEGMKTLADRYTSLFEENIRELNILAPTHLPRASEHIAEQIDLITTLEEKDHVYRLDDGIYFDTSTYPEYGALGGISDDQSQARIEHASDKRNRRDFALWKFNDEFGWDAPWGKGFPGWHLECSAMSMKYLGETFDIHTGGIDHIPVHHNNEIAQSECATCQPLARYWMHGAHMSVEGGKMSKSEGTTYTLEDLKTRHIAPLSYRYWLLTAHYRSPVSFSFEAVEGAHIALTRLVAHYYDLTRAGKPSEPDNTYVEQAEQALADDLDTPRVIALMQECTQSDLDTSTQSATLTTLGDLVGIPLADIAHKVIPSTVPNTVNEHLAARTSARTDKNWDEADRLRGLIQKEGYDIQDTPADSRLLYKNWI